MAASPPHADVAPLLAMGLNALNHAKDENDLPRRDALLDELRALAQIHPDDAAVRKWLATGFALVAQHADEEDTADRAAGLLGELRALAKAHPRDGWVEEFSRAGLL